ncbi:AAA family ATPase [Paenibacillus mucilaginosus]|nr:AAA family ATPase [Paenibacillus caseinilyticus]
MSGPAGVGKSTISLQFVHALQHSAYLSGDDISHMHVQGRKKPWESEAELTLIWNNILSLALNFVTHGVDVVVDYVTFPAQAKWLQDKLKNYHVSVVYVVLRADPETLLKRDRLRLPEHQMGERCLILLREFEASGVDPKHILDTSSMGEEDVVRVMEEIRGGKQYRLEE